MEIWYKKEKLNTNEIKAWKRKWSNAFAFARWRAELLRIFVCLFTHAQPHKNLSVTEKILDFCIFLYALMGTD